VLAFGRRQLREYVRQIVLVLSPHVFGKFAISVRRLIFHGVRKREQLVERAKPTGSWP
jgi:hypothetical protein